MSNGELTAYTQARNYLQPIAAPSILGLYGLAGATFMVAAHMAHWLEGFTTSLYLFPWRPRAVLGWHVGLQGP